MRQRDTHCSGFMRNEIHLDCCWLATRAGGRCGSTRRLAPGVSGREVTFLIMGPLKRPATNADGNTPSQKQSLLRLVPWSRGGDQFGTNSFTERLHRLDTL